MSEREREMDGWMDDILPTRLNSLRENAAPGHFIQFNSILFQFSFSQQVSQLYG